jgi:hypothetical protein
VCLTKCVLHSACRRWPALPCLTWATHGCHRTIAHLEMAAVLSWCKLDICGLAKAFGCNTVLFSSACFPVLLFPSLMLVCGSNPCADGAHCSSVLPVRVSLYLFANQCEGLFSCFLWQLSTGPLLSLFLVVQQDMPCCVMSLHAPLCGKAASALIKAPCLMSTFQCWNGVCSNRRLAQQTDKNSISVLLRQLASTGG